MRRTTVLGNAVVCLATLVCVVEGGTKNPTRAPTPAPSMMPTLAPTNYQAPPSAALNPGYFYAGVVALMIVLYVIAEATARILMGWKQKSDDDLELNHEDINPDYKLESYILSVLNVSKGVFSRAARYPVHGMRFHASIRGFLYLRRK